MTGDEATLRHTLQVLDTPFESELFRLNHRGTATQSEELQPPTSPQVSSFTAFSLCLGVSVV